MRDKEILSSLAFTTAPLAGLEPEKEIIIAVMGVTGMFAVHVQYWSKANGPCRFWKKLLHKDTYWSGGR
jgi:hypothetical protein